jgi:rod shape determining protein RodA
MVAKTNYKGIDWITVGLYITLVILGWLSIYAANFNPENPVFFDVSKEYFKQLIWIGLSLLLMGIIFLADSKFFVEFAYLFYGFTIFLLITVLFFGTEINGAKSWFEFGPVRFQPAELTKVATNLALARLLSRFGFDMVKKMNMLRIGVILLLPVVMILAQNDTGSALVYFVFIIVLYREGMSPYLLVFGFIAAIVAVLTLIIPNIYIAGLITVFVSVALFISGLRKQLVGAVFWGAMTALALFFINRQLNWSLPAELIYSAGLVVFTIFLLVLAYSKRFRFIPRYLLILWGAIVLAFSADYFIEEVLSDYQRTRINVLLGLEDDPLGAGYNVNQSKIAIGSGGFSGKGFLQGTQTKFDFVPEQSTDFIFCTVGEEWGFLGSLLVVILFVSLLLRILFLAERQHSDFSRIYGYGVAAIFFFHFAINIGMTIGLAPVIGIPLPFFSYGGSSLWGFTILLFIFLKLDTNRNELIR